MAVKNVNTERTYVNGKLVKGIEPYAEKPVRKSRKKKVVKK